MENQSLTDIITKMLTNNKFSALKEMLGEMNVVDIKDMSALALFGTCIVPHYTKFLNRYENLENICKQYEKETHSKLIQLNDGDGIIIENGVETLIFGS